MTKLMFFLPLAALCTLFAASAVGAASEVYSYQQCNAEILKQSDYGVCQIGSRISMFKKQDLSGSLPLDRLPKEAGFIGVGPVKGLQGEITLYDGTLHVSSIGENNQVIAVPPANLSAIFFALGYAKKWQAITVPASINGLANIETFVSEQATRIGIASSRSFPFKIEGKAEQLTFHVIFKDNHLPHSKPLHHKAKKKFQASELNVQVAGVFSTVAQIGHITHPGKRTHLHVIAGERSGHVDDLVIAQGSVLFLPVPKKLTVTN